MESLADLFGNYRVKQEETEKEKRWNLIKLLAKETGYSTGIILARTKKMQTPQDLRFILSSMKNVPKAKDAKHAFNIVLYQPK